MEREFMFKPKEGEYFFAKFRGIACSRVPGHDSRRKFGNIQ